MERAFVSSSTYGITLSVSCHRSPNYSPPPLGCITFSASVKYCLGTHHPTIHLGPGLEGCAIPAVCSSANRKENPSPGFYNVQLACRKGPAGQHLWEVYCSALPPAGLGTFALPMDDSEPSASIRLLVGCHPAGDQLEQARRGSQAQLEEQGKVSSFCREVM